MPCHKLQLICRDPEVDWPALIRQMRAAGLSLRKIGRAIAKSHSTIQKWERGSCPNFEDGKALLQLVDQVKASGRFPVPKPGPVVQRAAGG